jgi:hypothetical protein
MQTMEEVNFLMSNDVFRLAQCAHPTSLQTKLYYFQMQPLTEAHQEQLDLLSESLAMICQNSSGTKSSIILDCSALTSFCLLQRFWSLSFQKALGIDNVGLDKFVVLSTSQLVNSLSNGIIHIKRATDYTKICCTLQEALQYL